MWIPMWLVCMGISCQPLELVEEKTFRSKQECEKFAQDTAKELAKEYDRVGYKCNKSDNI